MCRPFYFSVSNLIIDGVEEVEQYFRLQIVAAFFRLIQEEKRGRERDLEFDKNFLVTMSVSSGATMC